jgi:phosphohistidine phosphatase SixA
MFTSTLIAVLTFAVAQPPDTTELQADSLLQALKQGGYTILLRHARTDRSYMDDPRTAPLDDRRKQRNLSDAGVADAKAIGFVMRSAQIPVAEIVSSPMFRAKETAQMAFGEPTLSKELMSLDASPDQRAVVAKAPKPGSNRAIVTHHFIIERYVPGIKLGDIAESEAAVVRITPNGEIQMVGRFTLEDWMRLSGGKTTAASNAEKESAKQLFVAIHSGGAGQMHPAPGSSSTLQPFVWTATPATRLAGLYMHTFNTGDAAQMRAFIEKSLVPDPNRSLDERVETYKALFEQHGALHPLGTERTEHNEASIRVKSRLGEFSLVVTLNPDDHAQASSIRMVGSR